MYGVLGCDQGNICNLFFILLFCVFVKNLRLFILIDSCICQIKRSHNVLNQTIKFDMHV
jgi:hypothetical protein